MSTSIKYDVTTDLWIDKISKALVWSWRIQELSYKDSSRSNRCHAFAGNEEARMLGYELQFIEVNLLFTFALVDMRCITIEL